MNELAIARERKFAVPMMIAAFSAIPLIALESSHVSHSTQVLLIAMNWIVWAIFVFEMVAMLQVVDDKSEWVKHNPLSVAVVVLTIPLISQLLPAIRVLRLLRLLRVLRISGAAKVAFSASGLKVVGVILAVSILAGGEAFSVLEHSSLFDGVYWAICTMTTVGAGDLNAATEWGKLLTVWMVMVGITFVAILTGSIAQRFVANDANDTFHTVEDADHVIAVEVHAIQAEIAALSVRMTRLADAMPAKAASAPRAEIES
jgi:voltage-gated potassium channel